MSLTPEQEQAIREHQEMEKARFCAPPPPHEHIRSGWTCLVDHGDRQQCQMCKVCGQWIQGEMIEEGK